jgi:hypothetical protein
VTENKHQSKLPTQAWFDEESRAWSTPAPRIQKARALLKYQARARVAGIFKNA